MSKEGSKRYRSSEDSSPRSQPRPRKRTRLWVIVALLLIGVWCLPIVAARLPARDNLIGSALSIDGRFSCSSISLGWLSPIKLRDAKVFDRQGRMVVSIPSLAIDRTLLALVWDRTNFGHITVEQPTLNVVAREDGSNVEDVLAPLLRSTTPSKPVSVSVQVTGGTAIVTDSKLQRDFQLAGVNAKVVSIPSSRNPLAIEIAAVAPAEGKSPTLACTLTTSQSEPGKGTPLAAGQARLKLDGWPAETVEPFARRGIAGIQLAGELTGELDAAWGQGASQSDAVLTGHVIGRDLRVKARALGLDEMRLDQLATTCRVQRTGDRVIVEKLGVESDLGSLAADGEINAASLASGSLRAIQSARGKVTGQLDLVKLAQMLPGTLRIREGTQLTSGKVTLLVTSEPREAYTALNGRLETTAIAGSSQGRQIVWDKPLLVAFDARSTASGFALERARCEASFLQIEAAGSPDELKATTFFNLGELAKELQQFVDFRQIQLSGMGDGTLAWKRSADGRFETTARASARNFQFVAPGRKPWQEENLGVLMEAQGSTAEGRVRELSRAALTVSAGSEQLVAQLTGAITSPQSQALPLSITWKGELAKMAPRLEAWLPLAGWELAGAGELACGLTYSAAGVEIQDLVAKFARLHVWGHQLYVDEPLVELRAAGRWDTATGRLDIPGARLTAGTADLQVRNATWQGGANVGGTAEYQLALNQLSGYLHDKRTPPKWSLGGQLSGSAQLTAAGNTSSARLDTRVTNFELSDLSVPATPRIWREPQLTVVSNINYDRGQDLVRIEQSQITADALACEIAGSVASPTLKPVLDLRGKLHYDWAKLAPLWGPYLGPEVKIAGRESRDFYLRGPWPSAGVEPESIAKLTGEAGFGWTSAEAFGLQIGPANIVAQLSQGMASVQPTRVQVSEGAVHLAPRMNLLLRPMELLLPKGPLVEQVRVTPQVCAQALKFIAPVLAEATQTDGRFSIDLNGGRLPVSDLAAGDVGGRLAVHSMQVRPGPLAQQFVVLGKQLEALIRRRPAGAIEPETSPLVTMSAQNIDFRVVNRRVHHGGLQFTAGKVLIKTHGSVGLDETLSITAEVPIDASWTGNDPSVAALRGQTLQIPIGGTLKNPTIDRRAFEKVAAQLVQSTARGALIDQLNKQFDKILPLKR